MRTFSAVIDVLRDSEILDLAIRQEIGQLDDESNESLESLAWEALEFAFFKHADDARLRGLKAIFGTDNEILAKLPSCVQGSTKSGWTVLRDWRRPLRLIDPEIREEIDRLIGNSFPLPSLEDCLEAGYLAATERIRMSLRANCPTRFPINGPRWRLVGITICCISESNNSDNAIAERAIRFVYPQSRDWTSHFPDLRASWHEWRTPYVITLGILGLPPPDLERFADDLGHARSKLVK